MDNIQKIPKTILKWFLFLYILNPILYILIFLLNFNFDSLKQIAPYISIVAFLVILISFVFFLILNHRLSNLIHRQSIQQKNNSDDISFLNHFQKLVPLNIILGNIIGRSVFVLIMYLRGDYFDSLIQLGYFFLIGIIFAAGTGMFLYYIIRKEFVVFYPYGYKILNLSERFIYPTLLIFTLTTTVLMVSILKWIALSNTENSHVLMNAIAKEYSKFVQSVIEVPLDEARSLSKVYKSLILSNRMSREDSNRILKSFMENSKSQDFLGVWVLFEPNRFDGRDNAYRNINGHDQTGRHMVYWVKNEKGELILEKIVNYENTDQASDFYTIPRQRKTEFVSDPFYYPVNGKDVLMVTTVSPILNEKNEFLGAVGIDMKLDDIANKIRAKSIFGDGYITIVSDKGTIISTKDKAHTLVKVTELYKGNQAMLDMLSQKDETYTETFSNISKQKIQLMGVPIQLGMTNIEWRTYVSLPKKNIQVIVNKMLIVFMVFAISTLVILGLSLYFISSPISKSINQLLINLENGSNGNLSTKSENSEIFEVQEIKDLGLYYDRFLDNITNAILAVKQTSDAVDVSIKDFASSIEMLQKNTESQNISVHSATKLLAESNHSLLDVSKSANQQFQLSSMTYRAIENLQNTIGTIQKETRNASEIIKNSTDLSIKGDELMKQTIFGIDRVDASTKKISEVITLISEISDQVNLLSLNAAIEAARAGVHGKGFAVVAREISKLAEGTASNAKTITNLVKNGLSEVRTGKSYIDQTSIAFKSIIDSVQKSNEIISRIFELSSVQNSESQKVLENSLQIKEIAELITKLTEAQKQINLEIDDTFHSILNESTKITTMTVGLSNNMKVLNNVNEVMNEKIEYFH